MELSVEAVVQAVAGELLPGGEHGAGTVLRGLSSDSRRVAAGSLFVAIPGERFDGHDFIADAVAAGCGGVLLSRLPEAPLGVPAIRVDDPVAALGRLAAHWRRVVNPLVVGVTGSSGKTTVKEMLAAIARERRVAHATPGNLNNHLGVPFTLLSMPKGCELLVVELGMNHAGEIAALTALAAPTVGVVTNVQGAHLGNFGGLEGVARAKGELLQGLPATGTAVIPAEGTFTELLAGLAPCPVVRFGAARGAQVRLVERITEAHGMRLVMATPAGEVVARMPYAGRHMASNALAAGAAALALGLDREAVAAGLGRFRLPPGRGEIHTARGGWTVVDDSYNANPGSMRAALATIAEHPAPGRRVAVLGDMLELGEGEAALHAGLAAAVAEAGVSLLATAGPRMAALHQAAAEVSGLQRVYREDPAAWLGELRALLRPGDLVLVKGSRGMRMERLVADLTG